MRSVTVVRRPSGAEVAGCASPVVARALAARGCRTAPDYSLGSLLPPTLGGLDATSVPGAAGVRGVLCAALNLRACLGTPVQDALG